MTLNFISSDQRIKCSISCYNTDKLSDIEEKLCMKYIELKHKDLFYIGEGRVFDKSLTLEENKIKDNMIILINDNEN